MFSVQIFDLSFIINICICINTYICTITVGSYTRQYMVTTLTGAALMYCSSSPTVVLIKSTTRKRYFEL